MIKSFILSILLVANSFFQNDPCEIYGSVCFVKSQYYSDFTVYIENGDNIADLAVFKEDSKLMADEEGIWFISDAPDFADYKIFITNDRRIADFSIEFIEERAFAGCP